MLDKISTIHKKLATCHPDLVAGRVKCQTCGRELHVDSTVCLRSHLRRENED